MRFHSHFTTDIMSKRQQMKPDTRRESLTVKGIYGPSHSTEGLGHASVCSDFTRKTVNQLCKGAGGGMSRLREMGACEGCSGGMVLTQGSGDGMNKKAE